MLDRRAARLRRDPPRALPLEELTGGMKRSMRKADRCIAAAFDFWRERNEFDVSEINKITFTRGVLSVHVPNASARYLVSQAMRCGLERETIRTAPAGISQIRVKG